jgi:hypothetical protein
LIYLPNGKAREGDREKPTSRVMRWVEKVSIESDIDSVAERIGEGYERKFGI